MYIKTIEIFLVWFENVYHKISSDGLKWFIAVIKSCDLCARKILDKLINKNKNKKRKPKLKNKTRYQVNYLVGVTCSRDVQYKYGYFKIKEKHATICLKLSFKCILIMFIVYFYICLNDWTSNNYLLCFGQKLL